MKVILFGASGMVGQGVLRECLLAADVETVLTIGRSALPSRHTKLQQLAHPDLFVYDDIADQLKGYDACLFCLAYRPTTSTKRAMCGSTTICRLRQQRPWSASIRP